MIPQERLDVLLQAQPETATLVLGGPPPDELQSGILLLVERTAEVLLNRALESLWPAHAKPRRHALPEDAELVTRHTLLQDLIGKDVDCLKRGTSPLNRNFAEPQNTRAVKPVHMSAREDSEPSVHAVPNSDLERPEFPRGPGGKHWVPVLIFGNREALVDGLEVIAHHVGKTLKVSRHNPSDSLEAGDVSYLLDCLPLRPEIQDYCPNCCLGLLIAGTHLAHVAQEVDQAVLIVHPCR